MKKLAVHCGVVLVFVIDRRRGKTELALVTRLGTFRRAKACASPGRIQQTAVRSRAIQPGHGHGVNLRGSYAERSGKRCRITGGGKHRLASGNCPRNAILLPRSLVGKEPESLFQMRDGTPDRATKLILVENGFRRARAVKEEIVRVELVTPIEIESAAVKLVAARALDDVDIAARAASLAGVILAGADTEFLHRVGIGHRHVAQIV